MIIVNGVLVIRQVIGLGFISLLFFILAGYAKPADAITVDIDGTEIMLQKVASQTLGASPKARVLWLPSEYGILKQEKGLAEQLAKLGIESWFVDFYEAMFLAPTASAVDNIDPNWTAKLIEMARQDANQSIPLWIIAPNKAAQTAVRGLQRVFANNKSLNQTGLIFINPNLYIETPSPGLVANYWPETSHINLPIMLIQSELSPWKLRVTELAKQFTQAGSDVFIQIIPKVRDRFYFRADALAIEQEKSFELAAQLHQAMQVQRPYLSAKREIKPLLQQATSPKVTHNTKSTQMSAYLGKQGLSLALADTKQTQHNLNNYQGQVVLVNFWASWCPPCVHEMPSMARLKNHYANQKFEILAVNLGENLKDVKGFLDKHPVNFPVLLDEDSTAVKQWQVFAYPSSYLIDKKGQIRFALFGATQWDEPVHLKKIDALLEE